MSNLTGARELNAVLKKLPVSIGQKVLIASLRPGANIVKKEAIQRSPAGHRTAVRKLQGKKSKGQVVNYGTIKSNLKTTVTFKSNQGSTIAIHVGKAFWAMFMEFGTRHQPARPFMRPAFDQVKHRALDKIGATLGKNVEKAALKLAGTFAKSGLVKKRRRR